MREYLTWRMDPDTPKPPQGGRPPKRLIEILREKPGRIVLVMEVLAEWKRNRQRGPGRDVDYPQKEAIKTVAEDEGLYEVEVNIALHEEREAAARTYDLMTRRHRPASTSTLSNPNGPSRETRTTPTRTLTRQKSSTGF